MCCAESLSRVWLFATSWTVACQVPLSMGILQARTVESVAMPCSRGCSRPGDWTQVSHVAGRFFTVWATIAKSPLFPCSSFSSVLCKPHHLVCSIWPSLSRAICFILSWLHAIDVQDLEPTYIWRFVVYRGLHIEKHTLIEKSRVHSFGRSSAVFVKYEQPWKLRVVKEKRIHWKK